MERYLQSPYRAGSNGNPTPYGKLGLYVYEPRAALGTGVPASADMRAQVIFRLVSAAPSAACDCSRSKGNP